MGLKFVKEVVNFCYFYSILKFIYTSIIKLYTDARDIIRDSVVKPSN